LNLAVEVNLLAEILGEMKSIIEQVIRGADKN
jgi:hypothetical protein